MSIQVIFRNVDRSPTLVSFIEKKTQRLYDLVKPNSNLYCYIEKLAHGLKISLSLDQNGRHYQAAAIRSNAYDGVGSVVRKVKRQLDHG